MGTSAVAGVATTNVFQAAGFKDKNHDRVIEKRSWKNLWANEGYDKRADINEDGRIIEVEAKYKIWLLSRSEFKNNPFTNDEKIVLGWMFEEKLNAILAAKDSMDKAESLTYLAMRMSIAGLFKEAFGVAQKIKYPYFSSHAVIYVITYMSINGLFKDALEMARTIENPRDRSESISQIALNMHNAELFKGALGVAKTIKDLKERSETIAQITVDMFDAGFFKEALDAARIIERPSDRSIALMNMLLDFAGLGIYKDVKKKILKEMLEIAQTLENEPLRPSTLSAIKDAMEIEQMSEEAKKTSPR